MVLFDKSIIMIIYAHHFTRQIDTCTDLDELNNTWVIHWWWYQWQYGVWWQCRACCSFAVFVDPALRGTPS